MNIVVQSLTMLRRHFKFEADFWSDGKAKTLTKIFDESMFLTDRFVLLEKSVWLRHNFMIVSRRKLGIPSARPNLDNLFCRSVPPNAIRKK